MPRVLITPAVYANGEGPWRPVLEQAGFEIVYPPGDCTALSLITAVFRDTCRRDREVRAGKWRRDCPRRLAGNTIGLVGLGRIGRAMTPRCQGLGLKVIAYDPYADAGFAAQRGIELVSFH